MSKRRPMRRPMNREPRTKIYILHGWSYSLEKWQLFMSALKNNKLSPLLLKIPGLTDEIESPWTIENYVDWLFDKVKNEKKIILIGHSNGGRIAMNFALKYQNKIEKLILIDSAGIYHNDLPVRIKRKVFKLLAKTGRKIFSFVPARKFLYMLAGESDYKKANEIMRKTMTNLIESDKTLEPDRIINSAIIIWGRKDSITPLSDARELNRQIANSKLYIVNNARHSPQFTHVQEVVDIIAKQFNNEAI